MFDDIEDINFIEYFGIAKTWVIEHLWTTNTIYQALIFLGCFIIASTIYSIIRPKLRERVMAKKLPATVERIARNLVRLTLPLMTLIFMFIAVQVATLPMFGIEPKLSIGIMKVLVAWIIIRTAVQFIANSTVRNVFAVVIWSIAVLSIFGFLEQTTTTLDSFAFTIGNFRLSALVVIKGLLMLFALLYFAIFLSSFAERKIFQVKGMTRSSQVLIAKITRVVLIVTALLIGITSAGIDLSLFAVFGGAIGLGIGFGLQKGISNLFSGMLLLTDRSIKPGDVIELPDIGTFGWVNNMAARYTEIVTRDNKSYLIPNEDFITQRVINWSHGNSLIRISVDFGVDYRSDMEKVLEIAIEAAKKPARVVSYREPVCWMTEFGESSVNFTLRFWIKDAEEGITNIKGEVLLELWKTLKVHNISIPFPHREVFIHEARDEKPAVSKPKKKVAAKKVISDEKAPPPSAKKR